MLYLFLFLWFFVSLYLNASFSVISVCWLSFIKLTFFLFHLVSTMLLPQSEKWVSAAKTARMGKTTKMGRTSEKLQCRPTSMNVVRASSSTQRRTSTARASGSTRARSIRERARQISPKNWRLTLACYCRGYVVLFII